MSYNNKGNKRYWQRVDKLLLCLALIFLGGGKATAQEQIEKLPELNRVRVRLVENASYCSAGAGTQGIVMAIDDELTYSEKSENYYVPHTNLFDSPYFRIGCTIKKIAVDYSYLESSYRFKESVRYEGIEYNIMEFQNHNLFVGYSFTILTHYLYLDAGAGYSHTQYTLDFTSNGNLRDSDKEELGSTDPFVRLTLKFFVTDYLFLHWVNQQSPKQANGIYFSNQLGLSFLVRL